MATAAAAVVARARREIQHHFFAADAVRPDRAVVFVPENRIQSRQFEQMQGKGIIRAVGGGRYWLDVVAYDDELHRRHKLARTIAVVAVLVLLIEILAINVLN